MFGAIIDRKYLELPSGEARGIVMRGMKGWRGYGGRDYGSTVGPRCYILRQENVTARIWKMHL